MEKETEKEIKVIGTGCDKCTKLYDNLMEALEISGCKAKVERVDDLMEIVKLGVMTAPSLMIDGKLAVSGRVAKTKEILKLLK